MLHPNNIEEKQFENAMMGGYKKTDVDKFFYAVSKDYKELFNAKSDLEKKIEILVEKISEYKADEEHIKEAILYSQKIKEDVMTQVNEAAQKVMNEAQEKHDEILKELEENRLSRINQAENEFKELQKRNKKAIETESKALTAIKREVSSFKHKLQDTYKVHLNSIMSLPFYDEKEDEELPSLDEDYLDEVTIDVSESNSNSNSAENREELIIENIEILEETVKDINNDEENLDTAI